MAHPWRSSYKRGTGDPYEPRADRRNFMWEGSLSGLGSEDFLAEVNENLIRETRRDW